MNNRVSLTAATLAFALFAGFGPALAQDPDPSSGAMEQLEGTVEPNSSAATGEGLSDENSSYLGGGGFDSAGDTAGAGDDGSTLEPQPFEASPNE